MLLSTPCALSGEFLEGLGFRFVREGRQWPRYELQITDPNPLNPDDADWLRLIPPSLDGEGWIAELWNIADGVEESAAIPRSVQTEREVAELLRLIDGRTQPAVGGDEIPY
jgi:hypothetical protein